jgi:hypothetical protein
MIIVDLQSFVNSSLQPVFFYVLLLSTDPDAHVAAYLLLIVSVE